MSIIQGILQINSFYSGITTQILVDYNNISRPILDVMHAIFNSIFYLLLYIAAAISMVYILIAIYSYFSGDLTKEKKFIPKKAPFVTIQIPTYNELAALSCAQRCLNFDYPKDKYEIIIGDDSNDPLVSAEIDNFAEKYAGRIKVTRRGNNEGFKPGNLKHMLKYSKGEILVIFDSDFLPKEDFLKRIVTPFIYDKKISAVQARWSYLEQNKNLTSILSSTITTAFHYVAIPFAYKNSKVAVICGSAEAIRKKDLIKLGGWRVGSLTEDIEYSIRLLKNGKKVIYLDKLECEGEVPSKPKDLFKQQMRWAYGVTESLKIHIKDIFKTKKIGFDEKFFILFFCSGYMFSFLLALLFVTGTMSFLTNAPGPIDLTKFFKETIINVVLTSGIVISSLVALLKSKNAKQWLKMIVASFSIGLIVTYYVNKGLFKLAMKKKVPWFMLEKKGNKMSSYSENMTLNSSEK